MTPASDPDINTTPPDSRCFMALLFRFLDRVVSRVIDPDDLKLFISFTCRDQIIGEMNCNANVGSRRILSPP